MDAIYANKVEVAWNKQDADSLKDLYIDFTPILLNFNWNELFAFSFSFLFSFLQLAIKNASDNNDKWNDKKKKKKKTQCRTLAYLPIQKKWIKDIRLKYGHVGEIHLAEWECRSSSKESKETGKKRDGGEEEPFETIQKKSAAQQPLTQLI